MKWIGQHIFDLKSRFRNDVTIDGDLTVSGTYTQIDTDVTTTEQWLVTNDGTGPAAIINQKGSEDIFDVQDDGTSVFYIEDGGNIGIGTTSPAGILDVSGADNDVFFRRNAGQYFKFTTDAHSNRFESAGKTVFIGTTDAQTLYLKTNDSSRLTITSAGLVGIGTTSPDDKLHVSGGNIRLTANSSTAAILSLHPNNGNSVDKWQIAADADGSNLSFSNKSTGSMVSTMYLKDDGNVGIGTTSPAEALDVRGVGLFGEQTTSISGSSHLQIARENDPIMSFRHLNSASAGQMGYINYYFKNTGGTETLSARMGAKHTTTHSSQPGAGLVFQTAPDGGSLTDRVIINEDGNVGIGTTSPSEKLDVAGNIKLNGNGNQLRDYNGNNILSNASNVLTIGSAAINTTYIRGNVGIGTASPSQGLHVVDGGILVSQFESSDNTTSQIQVTNSSGTDAYFGIAGSRLVLNNNDYGADHFSIDSSGNVGIGTTSPISRTEINQQLSASSTIDYPLTISSRDDNNSIDQLGGEGVGIKFRIAGNDASAFGNSLVGASIAAIRQSSSDTNSSTDLGFFVTQNDETLDESIRIKSNGNVGIGTTSPASLLHVAGTVQVGVDDTGHDVKFFGATSGRYMLWDESDDSLNLTDNTQLKIGAAADLRLYHDGSDSYVRGYNYDLIIMQDTADKDIRFKADDGSGGTATYLTLDGSTTHSYFSAGNVGIGTTAPEEKLSVSGSIQLTNQQELTWADIGDGNTGRVAIRGNEDDDWIMFRTDNSERMRLTSTGLGIGTTSPDATLEIYNVSTTSDGDGSATETLSGQDSILLQAPTSSTVGHTHGSITWHNGDRRRAMITCTNDNADGDFKGLAFYTRGTDGPGDMFESMRIAHSGDVGIGTTSPASLLHVAGTVQVGVDDTGHDVFFYGATSGKYMKWDESEDNLFFPDNTNILFGSGNDATIGVSSDNLVIKNDTAGKDIIFQCDDGSGGLTAYLTLDGSASTVNLFSTLTVGTGSATMSGVLDVTNTSNSYATGTSNNGVVDGDTGAIRTEGGISVAKKGYFGGQLWAKGMTTTTPGLEIRPGTTGNSGYLPAMIYRDNDTGSANYLLIDGTTTAFAAYDSATGGVTQDLSKMVRIKTANSAELEVHIGDSGSTSAELTVKGFNVGLCTSWILNDSVSGVAVSGLDKIYTITHGMGSSRNYGVQVIRNAANSGNGETVYTDVTRTDTTIVVTFALAPTAGDYTALVTKFPE